uniref:BED-type domain-containing protein n=1 Tax=Plectus sambesii TaxID=2011161 RepID=A0A914VLF9_9BILA
MVSAVWEYFDIGLEPGPKCKLCRKAVKRTDTSTKCLWSHLRYKHPQQFKKISQDKTQKKTRNYPIMDKNPPRIDETLKSQGRKGESESDETDTMIAQFLIRKNLAFSAVEAPEFQMLVCKGRPGYKVKSARYYSDQIVPQLAKRIIEPIVDSLKKKPFSFTSDGWSQNSIALLSVTTHLVGDDFQRKDSVLAAAPFAGVEHSGLNISEKQKEIFRRHGLALDQVVAVVRDGAPSMKAAADLLQLDSFQCCCHLLHLIVKDGLGAQECVRTAIGKCRTIANFFHHSQKASCYLSKLRLSLNIPNRQVPRDVPTRWNSTFYLIVEIVNQKQALLKFFSEAKLKKKSLEMALSEQDFCLLQKLIKLLGVFDMETKKLSFEQSTASVYIPTMKNLINFLVKLKFESKQESQNEMKMVVEAMLNSCNDRLKKVMSNDILIFSMFVDPRFKYDENYMEATEWSSWEERFLKFAYKWHSKLNEPTALEPLQDNFLNDSQPTSTSFDDPVLVEEQDEDDYFEDEEFAESEEVSQDSFSEEVYDIWAESKSPHPTPKTPDAEKSSYIADAKVELLRLKNMEKLKRNDCPFDWFRKNAVAFPLLSEIARILFSISATSVSSERLFSTAGLIYGNKLRNRLSAEKAEQAMLLKANLHKSTAPLETDSDDDLDAREMEDDGVEHIDS